MNKHLLSALIIVVNTLISLLLLNACGDGNSDTDGDLSENSDGDYSIDGDLHEDSEDIEIDDQGEEDSENIADGDNELEMDDVECHEDSETIQENDSEYSENDKIPEPSGIDGYLVVILHNLNTIDYTGHEISLLRLSESGEWSEDTEIIAVHDNPRAATFTPNGNRLVVTHDNGWISTFDIRNGEATLVHDQESDGYYKQLAALDYDRALLMDGNHIINGGGLAILNFESEDPTIENDLLPFSAPSGFALHPFEAKAAIFGVTPMGSSTEKYSDDMALVDISGFPVLLKNFDLWGSPSENVNPISIWPGFSPDGKMLAGGNDSMWGDEIGVVKLFAYENGAIEFLDDAEVETPSSYVFSDNGDYLYVGSAEKNQIDIFDVSAGTMEAIGSQGYFGIIENIIAIRKGPLTGHILAGAYNGPALLKVKEDGTLEEISRFALDTANHYMIGGMALGHEYE